MKIKLAVILLFLALTLGMTLLVGRYGFSLAELRELLSALAAGGPLSPAQEELKTVLFQVRLPRITAAPFNYEVLDVVLMGRSYAGPWYKYTGADYALAREGALIADGPVKEAITSSGICDLYGLRPDLLEKIINIYGKHNGMAC